MQHDNPYRVVISDPPWKFGDKLPGAKRGAEKHYSVMKTEDICMLQLPPIADDAMLFLWRVAGMQEDALAVMHMWGFSLRSEMVWVKCRQGVVIEDWSKVREEDLAFGMGRYTRHCHEVCLIGTRGKAASQVMKNHSVRSVFFAEREEHSKKPERFYELVEQMTGGEGPYLELFARRPRAGWITLGEELGTTLGHTLGDNIDGLEATNRDGSGDSTDATGSGVRAAGEGEPGSTEGTPSAA